jgi:mannose-1-phosphate guanylyltransferase
MFAVVLVGGFGTRLRPLTDHIPKPMLPVVHRPMIVDLVDRCAASGITDVVLALGFKPGPFAAAFDQGRHGDVRVHYAVEPEPLDTGGAIAFAARWAGIDDTFVVANGDVITDLDLTFLIDRHRRLAGDATIHLTPVDDPSAFGVVEIDASGAIHRFVEKPQSGETDSNLINAGTYVFEPAVLDLIEPGIRVSVERDTFQKLIDQRRLSGVSTHDYWIDTGRPDQFLQANLDLIRGIRGTSPEAISASASVSVESVVENSVVSDGAVVAAGAMIIDSVLLPGARVDADAVLRNSIVAGRVGAGARVDDCVIGADYSVSAGVVVSGLRLPAPD